VRVGVTTDTDEQRAVVEPVSSFVRQTEVVSETQCDEALPQHVFHRLAKPEIDAQ